MKFHVIDKVTGKEPDIEKIVKEEGLWEDLMSFDIEDFFISSDGKTLILADECGNWDYVDTDRFQVVWEVTNANK